MDAMGVALVKMQGGMGPLDLLPVVVLVLEQIATLVHAVGLPKMAASFVRLPTAVSDVMLVHMLRMMVASLKRLWGRAMGDRRVRLLPIKETLHLVLWTVATQRKHAFMQQEQLSVPISLMALLTLVATFERLFGRAMAFVHVMVLLMIRAALHWGLRMHATLTMPASRLPLTVVILLPRVSLGAATLEMPLLQVKAFATRPPAPLSTSQILHAVHLFQFQSRLILI